MFNVSAKPTFRRLVTVMVPDDKGHHEETLVATYRMMPGEEVKQHDFGSGDGLRKFLAAVIVKLDDVIGDDGKAIAFSPELLASVLNFPPALAALQATYTASVNKVKEGN